MWTIICAMCFIFSFIQLADATKLNSCDNFIGYSDGEKYSVDDFFHTRAAEGKKKVRLVPNSEEVVNLSGEYLFFKVLIKIFCFF